MLWQSWCPHCKSHRIEPHLYHGVFEKLLTLLVVPYRCTSLDFHAPPLSTRFSKKPAEVAYSHLFR